MDSVTGNGCSGLYDQGLPFQRVEFKHSRVSPLTMQLRQSRKAGMASEGASIQNPNMLSVDAQPAAASLTNNEKKDEASSVPTLEMKPTIVRRNMLEAELTGSLRRALLWERQQGPVAGADPPKRWQRANNVTNLRYDPEPRGRQLPRREVGSNAFGTIS